MPAGSVRYRHQGKGQWFRATQEQVEHASRIPPSGLDMGHPELGPQLLNARPEDMNVLLLSLDQKQSQWSACHFLVDPDAGLGTMLAFRGDRYRRSWRDFQWAMAHAPGRFNWTSVQCSTSTISHSAPEDISLNDKT